MDTQTILHILKVATGIGFALLLSFVAGGIKAQRKMAKELLAVYLSSARGSVARKEVHEAIAMIADEFNRLHAQSTPVWDWVHTTIKSFNSRGV